MRICWAVSGAALPAGICVIAVETPDEIGAALGVVNVPPPDGALRWEDWVMGFEPIGDPSTAVRGGGDLYVGDDRAAERGVSGAGAGGGPHRRGRCGFTGWT